MESLRQWFLENRRDLPWRDDPTPYQVWVSEVMLQQTRAETVIPYYLHWMRLFPSIKALARASQDEVIKAWEGLGYYSRARNLHAGAQAIVENFGGELPSSSADLAKIKGLGPYTIGAIRAFAFHKRAAAVDGNVIRVLTRLFAVTDDISKGATVKLLRKIAEELLPDFEPWVISEALIELGAQMCSKKAKCPSCPLKKSCKAYSKKLVEKLPFKSKKISYETIVRSVFLIENEGLWLVRQVPKGEVMEGLWEFPYVEGDDPKKFQIKLQALEPLKEESHSFTRYRCRLHPYLAHCKNCDIDGYQWLSAAKLRAFPFSSGHKKLLAHVL